MLMGRPAPRRGLRRLSWPISDRSLLTRLLQGLPGVDVRIVADPSLRGQAGDGEQLKTPGAETQTPESATRASRE